MLLFLICYAIAVYLYPGGSQADAHSIGFSWMHNYWCNLTNPVAVNGQANPGAVYALSGLTFSCLSVMAIFILFFKSSPISKTLQLFYSISGILALVCAGLIATDWHDSMTVLASLFGLISLLGAVLLINRSNWGELKWLGILCLVLVIANNYVYYTNHFLYYLPLLQKLMFIAVLFWFIMLNIRLTRKTDQVI